MDSLTVAKFCKRVTDSRDLPPVSIKDVYANRTMLDLASVLAEPATERPPVQVAPPPRPASTAAYLLCGFLQTLTFLGYAALLGVATDQAYVVISAGTGVLDGYLRAVAVGAVVFAAAALLPVLGKWLLVGRWTEREIRAWSLGYFRFWLVRTLVRANPLVPLVVGTPLYPLYLRALGAKVGRGVVILSRQVPVATDLVTIGAGSVVRKDVHFSGAAAVAGTVRLGRVTLGRDVVVGEKSVLDVDTAMGDGAQLGHASALHAGQTVPSGARFHGSPAVATGVDHRRVPPVPVRPARAVGYGLLQLVKILGVYLPLAFGGLIMLLAEAPKLRGLVDPGPVALNQPLLYLDALAGGAIVVFGGLLVAFVLVTTLPRLLGRAVRPDAVHPVYGAQYALFRTVARLTNVRTLVGLFGDSSFIVGYLRALGYDLGRVVQTGSNFGSAVSHDTPYLSTIGAGTMVADGLSIVNADVTATSFRVGRVAIGAGSFLGNHIAYLAGARVGDDCLLATKVAVPLDGRVRAHVGLLGSPAFAIPRMRRRDQELEVTPAELPARLRRKNRHNLVTLLLALLVRWVDVAALLFMALFAVDTYPVFGFLSFGVEIVASLVFTVLFFVLVERLGGGFRRRRPQSCSIYDRTFWRHERYWKLVMPAGTDRILAGTPWKNLVTRLLGAKIGRRVLDMGAAMTERTLLTIGDDVTLDEGSILQCHSQEDGAFKSDHTELGAGASVGSGALVHYGVTVGAAARRRPRHLPDQGRRGPARGDLGRQPGVRPVAARAVRRRAGGPPGPGPGRPRPARAAGGRAPGGLTRGPGPRRRQLRARSAGGRNSRDTSAWVWLVAPTRRMTSATATPRTPASVIRPSCLVVMQRTTRAGWTAAHVRASSAAAARKASDAVNRANASASGTTTSTIAWYCRSSGLVMVTPGWSSVMSSSSNRWRRSLATSGAPASPGTSVASTQARNPSTPTSGRLRRKTRCRTWPSVPSGAGSVVSRTVALLPPSAA